MLEVFCKNSSDVKTCPGNKILVGSQSGFTLIEVMITLVIVSIVVSLAMLSLQKNPAKELQREASRLQLVLQHASNEAVIQGIELALAVPENGYQFLYFDVKESKWLAMNEKEFQLHRLPEGIKLSLEIDGKSIDQEMYRQMQVMQNLNTEKELQPVLLLLSSGETTPFRITFQHVDNDLELYQQDAGVIAESLISSDGVSGIILR